MSAGRGAPYDQKVGQLSPSCAASAQARSRSSHAPKKSTAWRGLSSVPQTDSGGRGENPKALERTLSKELGKLPP